MSRLLFLFWLFPLVEWFFLVAGWLHHMLRRARRSGSGADRAIIQITTIGNYETVNRIVSAIRNYRLPFLYEIWIITEPHVAHRYEQVDRVYRVPADFAAKSRYKARAQEYSRRLRQQAKLDRRDLKIFMLDDDSLPTREYFLKAFEADFDICEGILVPRIGYGRFLSHLDDIRTHNCLTVCAFWQGIGHPIWVHGEGLCIRGSAESAVTWNFPVIASEDLTFGQNAVETGLTWGFVWDYVQITSPWSFRDFVTQRRRWIWGNIHALREGLIPPLASFLLTTRWILGLLIEIVLLLALPLILSGVWEGPSHHPILWVSLVAWFGLFGYAAWLGAQGVDRPVPRAIDTFIGMCLAPVTLAIGALVTLYAVLKGAPSQFDVIVKARPLVAGWASR